KSIRSAQFSHRAPPSPTADFGRRSSQHSPALATTISLDVVHRACEPVHHEGRFSKLPSATERCLYCAYPKRADDHPLEIWTATFRRHVKPTACKIAHQCETLHTSGFPTPLR